MGLQTEIGYKPVTANVAQRMVHKIAATRVATTSASRFLASLDRSVHRISRGRTTVAAALGGFPTVLLTTTGAKTGKLRTSPLNVVPVGADLAVLGTNYGTGVTPGWVHNLRTNAFASITYNRQTYEVVARLADPEEHEEAFVEAIRIYPGYAVYRRSATNEIPVFVLTSKGPE